MDFEDYKKYINTDVAVLALVAFAAFFYFSVALASPIVFGDENNYAVNGKWIAENLIIPEYHPYFQTEVMHNLFNVKPLFYMFTSMSRLTGGEFLNRLILPVFSILTSLLLYVFLKKQGLPIAGTAAAFAFLMVPGIVTYGVLNYVETANALLFAAAAIFGFYAFGKGGKKNTILAGIFSGFTLLTDTTGVFIIPLFALYFILLNIGKFARRSISKPFFINSLKTLVIILAISAVMLAPWLARNISVYGKLCYSPIPIGADCPPKYDVKLDSYSGADYAGPQAPGGTGSSVAKMGFSPYFNFAFGWSVAILMLFGLAALALRKDRLSLFVGVWFFIFLVVMLQQSFFGGRAEDTPRYTLFGFASLALIVGVFANEGFGFFKKLHDKAGVIFGIIFIIFILSSLWVYGADKLNTMRGVKAFSPGFFEACSWVQKNTPKDSYIFSTYAQQVAYACDRKSTVNLPDQGFIQLSNSDSAYEHLKLHGFDYVFVPRFTVSIVPYSESISLKMLGYMESSPHFKKVYDSSGAREDYVLIYQVLPETNSTAKNN